MIGRQETRKVFTPPARGKRPAGGGLVHDIAISLFRWKVDQINWDGPWGWRAVGVNGLLTDIIPKLHDFETMTWAAIDGTSGSHSVSCDDIIPAARARLDAIRIEV